MSVNVARPRWLPAGRNLQGAHLPCLAYMLCVPCPPPKPYHSHSWAHVSLVWYLTNLCSGSLCGCCSVTVKAGAFLYFSVAGPTVNDYGAFNLTINNVPAPT